MSHIAIGSGNPTKIAAVQEVVSLYSQLQPATFVSVQVTSGVPDQPTTLKEVMLGAVNRAKNAFQAVTEAGYGVGMESGLVAVPYSRTGYLDFCACVVYDGHNVFTGFSSGIEFPQLVTNKITREGLDSTQAFNAVGLTKNQSIGSEEGVISVVTEGKVNRKAYTKQGLVNAFASLFCR